MEVKPGAAANSRKKLFQKIQKAAASGISFQNPDPFSPRKDIKSHLKTHHHHHRGFSGPIIIPEARRHNTNKFDVDVAIEPTSPKISCMGQIIKQKKKNIISKKKTAPPPPPPSKQENHHPVSPVWRNSPGPGFWTSRTIYNTERPVEKGSKKRGKDFGEASEPPRLGQLKKYASVRETLSNFDWKTATATENGEEEENDEVIIPFSAPLIMGGGIGNKPKPVVELERKKEINLWKRRTMAQPSPLHLNSVSA